MATATNLVDLIEPIVSGITDIAIRNIYRDIALYLVAR